MAGACGTKAFCGYLKKTTAGAARPYLVKRLRNILAVLITAADMTEVVGPSGWCVHQLKGDRTGSWSISVSGNWRLTFELNLTKSTISTWTWRTTIDE
jgi:proteic killer suppression protein